MSKIKDLPKSERPREKALRFGIEKLSDYELIALLIGSGYQDHSALDVAYKMITENGGLHHLIGMPTKTLIQYKGIGQNKAIKIETAFEIARRFQSFKQVENDGKIDTDYIYNKYKYITFEPYNSQEHLFLIILDHKKRIVREINLYKGNDCSVNYSYNQIIRHVLIHNGKSFYIIHNHPSDNMTPSLEDVEFTTNLIAECKKLKITMLDHLIITRFGYYSFLRQSVIYNN